MKTNQQFKNAALDALRGNWGKAALVSLLYLIVEYAVSGPNFFQSVKMMQFRAEHHVSSIYQVASLYMDPEYQSLQQTANGVSGLSTLLYILVLFPLSVGFINAMRRLLVFSENDLLGNTLHIAFQNYWHKVWGMLWMTILTVLWGFLFIIPGIIKSLSYAMTPFILEENPELTASEAIHRSRMMMHGHKFDLFWLYLGFIGWIILSLLTLGIGFIWLYPYFQASVAGFYEEVKAEYAMNGGLD